MNLFNDLLNRATSSMNPNIITVTQDMFNDKLYNGAEPKQGITINGIDYLMKRQKKDWNNVITEYVASNIINVLGGNAHETTLAIEDDKYVVLCKDFTADYGNLKSLSSLSESTIDTDITAHEYFYEDMVYELSKLKRVNLSDVNTKFLQMYTFDSILGNADRHRGNWALYKDNGVYKFAPLFDNAASLFPRANYDSLSYDWIKERVFVFPNSKIMFNGRRERSNYYDVWRSDILSKDIVEWANSLVIQDAIDWIYSEPYLEHNAKRFYATMVECRYNVIIRGDEFTCHL